MVFLKKSNKAFTFPWIKKTLNPFDIPFIYIPFMNLNLPRQILINILTHLSSLWIRAHFSNFVFPCYTVVLRLQLGLIPCVELLKWSRWSNKSTAILTPNGASWDFLSSSQGRWLSPCVKWNNPSLSFTVWATGFFQQRRLHLIYFSLKESYADSALISWQWMKMVEQRVVFFNIINKLNKIISQTSVINDYSEIDLNSIELRNINNK